MNMSPEIPPDRSDADLLRRALTGDESAFVALYGRLKDGIFRYAFYMTNSKSAAEEATQEVFILLLKQGGNYRESRGDVGAFAFGIARNLVRRIERRERPYHPLPPDESLENFSAGLISDGLVSESPAGEVMRRQITERVQAAIATLPEHYRQAVVLCDLCELSYEEAASRLRCAVGTIRSRLNRAHALLATKLKPLCKGQAMETAGPEECLI